MLIKTLPEGADMAAKTDRQRTNDERQKAAAAAHLRDLNGQHKDAANKLVEQQVLPCLRGKRSHAAVRTEMVEAPFPCYIRYEYGHIHLNCRARDVLSFIAAHKDLRQYDCRIAEADFMGFVLTIKRQR